MHKGPRAQTRGPFSSFCERTSRRCEQALRCEAAPCVAEYSLQFVGMQLRHPHQHHRVVAIVLGEVERLGLAFDQYLALAEFHSDRERLAVFLHSADKFLAHAERQRAVRGSFFDAWEAKRDSA